jgi:hypothetical protein
MKTTFGFSFIFFRKKLAGWGNIVGIWLPHDSLTRGEGAALPYQGVIFEFEYFVEFAATFEKVLLNAAQNCGNSFGKKSGDAKSLVFVLFRKNLAIYREKAFKFRENSSLAYIVATVGVCSTLSNKLLVTTTFISELGLQSCSLLCGPLSSLFSVLQLQGVLRTRWKVKPRDVMNSASVVICPRILQKFS